MAKEMKDGERFFNVGGAYLPDPKGDHVYRAKVNMVVPDSLDAPPAPAAPPTVAPMLPSLKSTGSGRFFTKAAAEEKLRGKVASAAPTADERVMIASLKADKARWDGLPDKEKLGSFKTWVETKYAQRTTDEAKRLSQATGKKFKGHDVPGVLERAFNVVTDLGSGRSNARGGMRYEPDDPLLQNEDFGGALAAFSSMAQHGINAIPFGKGRVATDEERDLETYKRLRSPVEERGAWQATKDVGEMAITNPKQMAIEMFNPDDAVVNLATAVPLGGVVAKGAGLAGKAGIFAGKGAKIAANSPRLAKAGMLAADVGAGAALGGGIQTIQGDEGFAQDFATGALPGAIMGGSSAVLGGTAKGGLGLARRTMDKLAGVAPEKAQVVKPSTLITPLEEAIQKVEARKMFEAGDPTAQVQLTAAELAAMPEFKRITSKLKRGPDEEAVVAKYAPLFVQNLDQFPVDKQAGVLQAAIEAAGKQTAEQTKGGAKAKAPKFDRTKVDALMAKYIPAGADAAAVPDLIRVGGIKNIMDTHAQLKRAAAEGMTMEDGSPIPLRSEVENLNLLEEKLKQEKVTADARRQNELDRATTAEETAALKEKHKQEVLDEQAKQQELKYERGVTELTSKLRVAALKEDQLPGSNSYRAALQSLSPEELGIVVDDAIAGSGRFDSEHQVMGDLLGEPVFNALLDLRKALSGNEKAWKTQSKEVLGIPKKQMAEAVAGQQKTMDDAVASEGIRQGVAQAEETAAIADQAAAQRTAQQDARATKVERIFQTADEAQALDMIRDEIAENPQKAELLLDEDGQSAAALVSDESKAVAKAAKARLEPLLVDAVRKIRSGERSLPKGFF